MSTNQKMLSGNLCTVATRQSMATNNQHTDAQIMLISIITSQCKIVRDQHITSTDLCIAAKSINYAHKQKGSRFGGY